MKTKILELKGMIKRQDEHALAFLSELIEECKTDADKKVLDDLAKELMSETNVNIAELEQEVESYSLKEKLGDLSEVINFAYIAKVYFGKTKAWMYQRLNGNLVNGKPAEFTSQEKKIFYTALSDISNKLKHITTL